MRSSAPNPSDLSGPWTGVFNYPNHFSPVYFSATLVQDGVWITGATEELGHSRDGGGRTMSATLQGRRDGARVTWLKLYDRLSWPYDAVAYAGEVTRDFLEISGRWNIPESWSGTFLMIRAPKKAAVQVRRATDPIRSGGVRRRTCCNTPPILCIGGPGAWRRSPRPKHATVRSCSRSATPRAIGAT
jgi:hypothetical protein